MLTRLQRISIFALFTCAVAFLYLYNLNGTGVLEPDEPRYASIGRAMAQSGDWVTPRLWGSPWFEKPAFLYWMTALGTEAGLDLDLSGRLPVALLSLVFLLSGLRYYGTSLANEPPRPLHCCWRPPPDGLPSAVYV